jgi:hypothetical protein
LRDDFNDVKKQWGNFMKPTNRLKRAAMVFWATWLLIVHIYAKGLSPVSLIFFVVFIEWTISFDIPGESFRHVGQWGPLVAAVLVFISFLVHVSWPKLKSWIRAWGITSLILFTTLKQ